MTETKQEKRRRYRGRKDGRYKPFDSDPEWSDMVAMLSHYGEKDEAWLSRRASDFAAMKKTEWGELRPQDRCQFANDVHTLVHSTAYARGWTGRLFAVREEYND